jgi:hypothetical protein
MLLGISYYRARINCLVAHFFLYKGVYCLVHLRKDPNIIAIFISNHLIIFGTQESCSKFSWQLHADRRLVQVLIQMMLVSVYNTFSPFLLPEGQISHQRHKIVYLRRPPVRWKLFLPCTFQSLSLQPIPKIIAMARHGKPSCASPIVNFHRDGS